MQPYTSMMLIFYRTPAVFFCDAAMYIYDDSTALEPHSLSFLMRLGSYHNTMSTSRPKKDSNFAFWQIPMATLSCLISEPCLSLTLSGAE